MAYGDSANWIGTVPVASAPTVFTIEFQCKFKGREKTSTCEFKVRSGQTEHQVAPEHCARWNEQNGGGVGNQSGHPNRYHRVSFKDEVLKMWVRGYPADSPPANDDDFELVKFGKETEALKGYGGLYVFNA